MMGIDLTKYVILDNGYVQLINHMGNDLSIVHAARVSLNKDIETYGDVLTEKDKQLITYLLENKHTSPFEHVQFTFLVKCPLFIRSQWHRHRTWSYNEVSRRYTSEEIDFYIPRVFRKQASSNRQASTDEEIWNINGTNADVFVHNISELLLEKYYDMLQAGVAREQARMILPQNMYTRFYATVDLWNLMHFIELRDSSHSQYEMQLYAKALKRLAELVVPETIKIWDNIAFFQTLSYFNRIMK